MRITHGLGALWNAGAWIHTHGPFLEPQSLGLSPNLCIIEHHT